MTIDSRLPLDIYRLYPDHIQTISRLYPDYIQTISKLMICRVFAVGTPGHNKSLSGLITSQVKMLSNSTPSTDFKYRTR